MTRKALVFYILLINCIFIFASGASSQELSFKPIVRSISIEIKDIFEGDDLPLIYSLANQLKIKSRKSIIKRELLFGVDEEYDAEKVVETERILRNFSFIREVHIIPFYEGEFVDILVSAQSTWTIFPQLSFALGGGDSSSEIGISESNLFGYGKKIGFFLSDNDGRKGSEFTYDDPRIFNSSYRFRLSGIQREDGYAAETTISDPFRSLIQDSAWEINFSSSDLVQSLFENGDERFVFRQESTLFQPTYSYATFPKEFLTRRYGFGVSYAKDTFSSADEEDFRDIDVDPNSVQTNDPSELEESRAYRGVVFGFRQIYSDYKTFQYVDRFERELDYNMGIDFGMNLFLASKVLNSTDDVASVDLFFRDGVLLDTTEMFRYALQYRTRVDDDGLENSIFNANIKYFNVLGPRKLFGLDLGRHTIASSFEVDTSENLDRNLEFLHGASSGLRGYENNTFTGNHRLRLNLEYRMHHLENILKLLNFGSVVFFDGGGASRSSVGNLFRSAFYSNVGFGLRIGFPRSSGGGVLSIDVAFPLREDPSGEAALSPTYFISAGQAFSSFFPGESTTVQTVSSEFLR